MKKLVSLLLVLLITMTCTLSSVSAADFPDVTDDNYSWAIEEISTMADMGIIAGYPDGTFKPENGITNLQALLLTARILGVDNTAFQEITPMLESQYTEALSPYSIAYTREVSFLLNRGVLTESELSTYLSDATKDTTMKRYEVAILLTKLMGAEASVLAQETSHLTFADTNEIPQAARPYVQFVYEEGLMQGMPGNLFSPNTEVTRAQMAVMLKRALDACNITFVTGTYYTYNYAGKSINVIDASGQMVSVPLTTDTTIKFDGAVAEGDKIARGAYVAATLFGSEVISVDAISPAVDETVLGVVKSTEIAAGRNIYVYDPISGATTAQGYPLADSCFITKNGSVFEFSQIKANDYVKLQLSGEVVSSLEVLTTEETFNATVVSITTDDPVVLELTKSTGETVKLRTYPDCRVLKNNAAASLRDVYPGQTVSVSTEYGVIETVSFTVRNETLEGTISEIRINQFPQITITREGQEYQYSLSKDATITVEGQSTDIYGLRLGYVVSLTLESGVITRLTTKSVIDTQSITGTVMAVNESYGFISVLPAGSETPVQIFLKSNATIITSGSSAQQTIRDIKVGSQVTCVGGYSNGAFEASTIVIIPQ